jgi:hypothetical protein
MTHDVKMYRKLRLYLYSLERHIYIAVSRYRYIREATNLKKGTASTESLKTFEISYGAVLFCIHFYI